MTYQPSANEFFVAGGTLSFDAVSYVERQADAQLRDLSVLGELCYVLSTRQMGKSSLMIRTAAYLKEQDILTAAIELNQISLLPTEEWYRWYLSFLETIRSQLDLNLDVQEWWAEHDSLSYVGRFTKFFQEVVVSEIENRVVIFIDEIDSALKLDFSDDFFAAIRAIYNSRATYPDTERLSFVLLGVAAPSDLIKDSTRTPFNIGTRIELRELELADTQRVQARGLPGDGSTILERIFYWTNGHPYLTQKIGQAIVREPNDEWGADKIDKLVKELFLTKRARIEDSNLQFVNQRVIASSNKDRLLAIYQTVHSGIYKIVNDERSSYHNELKSYGLLGVNDYGKLAVRNRIYRLVFDQDWIDQNLPIDRAKFGRYEIRRELDRGRMSSVYLAYDSSLDKDVILKVFPTSLTAYDPQIFARFERDLRTVTTLEHPAIVPIYDYGFHDNQLFIATRYMRGGSLNDRLASGPLSIGYTASIIKRVAQALDSAHSQGVLHNDIKPSNILFDESGQVYLADFAVINLLGGSDRKTQNTIIGTPTYISPEQASGNPIDGRSDIYSLGVVLFKMLAGKVPYETDTPIAVALMHVNEPIPNIISINPALPKSCQPIIERALAKKPRNRYPEAKELAADIKKVASGEKITSPSDFVMTVDVVDTIDTAPVTEDIVEHSDQSTRILPKVPTSRMRTSRIWPLAISGAIVAVIILLFLLLQPQGVSPIGEPLSLVTAILILLGLLLLIIVILIATVVLLNRDKAPVRVVMNSLSSAVTRITKPFRRSEPRAYLEVIAGDVNIGKVLEIYGDTPIGRSRQNAELLFQQDDETSPVSRLHCTISDEEDHFLIRDEGSANGTYLNGSRLQPLVNEELLDGDEIELARVERGGVRLQFRKAQVEDGYFGGGLRETRQWRQPDRADYEDDLTSQGDRF